MDLNRGKAASTPNLVVGSTTSSASSFESRGKLQFSCILYSHASGGCVVHVSEEEKLTHTIYDIEL